MQKFKECLPYFDHQRDETRPSICLGLYAHEPRSRTSYQAKQPTPFIQEDSVRSPNCCIDADTKQRRDREGESLSASSLIEISKI